ncbi:MAG: transglutaminase-like domain-containing protein [Candidatus Bathyarchaeia archaeon]
MDKKWIALVFIILLIGFGGGLAFGHIIYREMLSTLSSENHRLKREYSELNSSYLDLQNNYRSLLEDYYSLQNNYRTLQSDYHSLQSSYYKLQEEYEALSMEYDIMLKNYGILNNSVFKVFKELKSYVYITEAFPRVLNNIAVNKTADAVKASFVSRSNFWQSIQNIYNYITRNINYASDVEMPYIVVSSFLHWKSGEAYASYIDIATYQNYVQTPELTLRIKQGDCDDQAILAYAMIEYYMKYVYGTEYVLYLAYVEFSKGTAHLAVFLPVQGGKICIIDPAGNYLTSYLWTVTSKPAFQELQTYSNYWTRDAGSITHITLYQVNVTDGSYTMIASGTIDQVATIFT